MAGLLGRPTAATRRSLAFGHRDFADGHPPKASRMPHSSSAPSLRLVHWDRFRSGPEPPTATGPRQVRLHLVKARPWRSPKTAGRCLRPGSQSLEVPRPGASNAAKPSETRTAAMTDLWGLRCNSAISVILLLHAAPCTSQATPAVRTTKAQGAVACANSAKTCAFPTLVSTTSL